MAKIYKVILTFNLNNLSTGQNSFIVRDPALIPYTDGLLLPILEDWVTSMWDSLRNHMDSGCTLISGAVDEIDNATGEVIRHVGNISPSCNGAIGGDALTHFSAGSAFARTGVPGVRGSKRIAGLSEASSVDGLWTNLLLAALGTFASRWLVGLNPDNLEAGVWSSKVSSFVPFVPQGGVTNVPGTQVSRKIGRGM